MKSSTGQRGFLFLFLVTTVWFSFYVIKPPEPKPKSSDPTIFSAERAFSHVQQIARKPHPLGTSGNDSVRQYIVEELKALDLQPEVRQGIGVSGSFRSGLAGHTKNIFTEIKGINPQNTILLMTHYDSAPNAPGAADDASGVAAILESLRALKSQSFPLKNNIWVLITDGEERGLLGAESFADNFEQLDEIDLVLNFEARGSSGASMMFETSSPNAKLIQHFATATPHPVANSLMYTVYKLLPNDTDLSVTKRAGLKGLNFAFAKDFLNYHTMQDNPGNLSLSSLQHHGSNLLGSIRHFGNSDFQLDSNIEYVYFNNVAGGLSYYPSAWSFPLAIVTALLLIAYLIYLFRTQRLSLGRYLGSLLLYLGIILAGAILTYFGWQSFKQLHPQYQWLSHGEVYTHQWYLWGFSALMLTLFAGIYQWVQKKWLSMQQLLSAPFTIWILLSLVTAWYLPTASYIFTWPALMALVGWIVLGDQLTDLSWRSVVLLAISLSGVLFLIPPYISLVQTMLTTELLAVSMVLFILVLGLIWPMIWQVTHRHNQLWYGGLAILGLAFFIIAATNSGFDTDHKKQNDMSYIQNLDTGKAYWISRDDTTDEWTQQFLGTDYQKGTMPDLPLFKEGQYLYQQTKVSTITSPKVSVLSDSNTDSLRIVSMEINARERAIAMRLDWDRSSSIKEITFDGKKIFSRFHETGKNSDRNHISFFKDLSQATKVDLTLLKNSDITSFTFTFLKMGLPTSLIKNYEERAPYMMPTAHWNSNTTLWQVTVNPDSLNNIR